MSSAAWTGRPDIRGALLGIMFAGFAPVVDGTAVDCLKAVEPEYQCDFAPATSCSCHISAPCSYCTSRVDCEECGDVVHEDDLAVHMDEKHPGGGSQ